MLDSAFGQYSFSQCFQTLETQRLIMIKNVPFHSPTQYVPNLGAVSISNHRPAPPSKTLLHEVGP